MNPNEIQTNFSFPFWLPGYSTIFPIVGANHLPHVVPDSKEDEKRIGAGTHYNYHWHWNFDSEKTIIAEHENGKNHLYIKLKSISLKISYKSGNLFTRWVDGRSEGIFVFVGSVWVTIAMSFVFSLS